MRAMRWVCLPVTALFLVATSGRASPALSRPRTRRAFAEAMVRVASSLRTPEPDEHDRSEPSRPNRDRSTTQPGGTDEPEYVESEGLPRGMTEPEALALLGPPDETLVPGPPHYYDDQPQPEPGEHVLRYGVDGPDRTATLGAVWIDAGGRVRAAYGGKGTPPDPRLITERELRRGICLLDELPREVLPMGATYDPLTMIRIVNQLQRLGKERALAVVGEFCRVHYSPLTPEMLFDRNWEASDRAALHGLMYLLFTLPDRLPNAPEFFVWSWSMENVRDVPLMTSHGGGIGGSVAFSQYQLEQYRQFGRMLTHPLSPPDRPWEVVDELHGTAEWKAATPQIRLGMRVLVANQVLRMVGSVYPLEPNRFGELIPGGPEFEKRWEAAVADLQRLDLRWDPKLCDYRLADGTVRAHPRIAARQVYRTTLSIGGVTVRATIGRWSDYEVTVQTRWSGKSLEHHLDDAAVRAYAGAEGARACALRPPPYGKPDGWAWVGPGAKLRLELTVGDKQRDGPTLHL